MITITMKKYSLIQICVCFFGPSARRDSCEGGIMNTGNEEKSISDVLDETREYIHVSEDNEGDRVLVADVL